jgi:transposase-like protein
MSKTEKRKKKRKKRQFLVLEEQTEESPDLIARAEELEKEGKLGEIQVCPKCKSPRVRRVKTMQSDLGSHLGWTPPRFECEECGWRAHLVLKATNKRLSFKDVEIIAEASDDS